ncbi:DNA cytosine methyltransferase [Enterovibrio norvegicus]|uniref:DNA cytosine methyltransferase n=1 Tax=Enterovibrio norvegicus TaxID=188144 RepID=UPI00352BF614
MRLNNLDLFTGIGGWHLAAERNGHIETICTSEIDPYKVKFIDRNLGLDNAGSIINVAVPAACHPHSSYADDDRVAVEETGFTSLCIEDFYEGIIPFPDSITGSFPCREVSPANTLNNEGINGEHSSLIHEQLRIIEDLEPRYVAMENSELLRLRGLDYILSEFNRMGYCVEYETVAACHFGLPHYRHRLYLVAYLPDSAVGQTNTRVFDSVRKMATKHPNDTIPFMNDADQALLDFATVREPKSIKLRTKRINALGDAIIVDIAEGIFAGITHCEQRDNRRSKPKPRSDEMYKASLTEQGTWAILQPDLFDPASQSLQDLPARGLMINGELFSGPRDPVLNPAKTMYPSVFSTILRRDGNNNFTCKSRLNRPGRLGGVIGDLMRLGCSEGGLNPEFAEVMMGYERGYTALKSK